MAGAVAPVQEQARVEGRQSEVDFLRGPANSNKADRTTGDRAPAPPAAPSANSVTFFTGKNFDDFSGDNLATGVRPEAKCADVRGGFRSPSPDGAVKIWSEPGCRGKPAVVSDDVRDTAELGFPNGAQSYIRP